MVGGGGRSRVPKVPYIQKDVGARVDDGSPPSSR
jgi:hypothetical protein